MKKWKQPTTVSLFDGKTYTIGRWWKKHLLENNIYSNLEYFTHFKELYGLIPHCSYCNNKVVVKHFFPLSTRKTCGSKMCCNKEVSKSHLNRYKEDIDKSSEKRKITSKKLYGVEYVSQCKAVVDKQKQAKKKITESGLTVQELNTIAIQNAKEKKYGDKYYNNSKQISETKQKYSKEKIEEINKKRTITNIKKYGVSTPLLGNTIISKSNKSNSTLKDYTLPSGKIVKVRGYEPRVIDILLKTYTENEIIISDETDIKNCGVPNFSYINEKGNKNIYYPDIYIPSENKIIEVKSQWWYDAGKRIGYEDRLKNNLNKRDSVLKNNYNFEFWIYNKNKLTIIEG